MKAHLQAEALHRTGQLSEVKGGGTAASAMAFTYYANLSVFRSPPDT
jgi:hypothetical protein